MPRVCPTATVAGQKSPFERVSRTDCRPKSAWAPSTAGSSASCTLIQPLQLESTRLSSPLQETLPSSSLRKSNDSVLDTSTPDRRPLKESTLRVESLSDLGSRRLSVQISFNPGYRSSVESCQYYRSSRDSDMLATATISRRDLESEECNCNRINRVVDRWGITYADAQELCCAFEQQQGNFKPDQAHRDGSRLLQGRGGRRTSGNRQCRPSTKMAAGVAEVKQSLSKLKLRPRRQSKSQPWTSANEVRIRLDNIKLRPNPQTRRKLYRMAGRWKLTLDEAAELCKNFEAQQSRADI